MSIELFPEMKGKQALSPDGAASVSGILKSECDQGWHCSPRLCLMLIVAANSVIAYITGCVMPPVKEVEGLGDGSARPMLSVTNS